MKADRPLAVDGDAVHTRYAGLQACLFMGFSLPRAIGRFPISYPLSAADRCCPGAPTALARTHWLKRNRVFGRLILDGLILGASREKCITTEAASRKHCAQGSTEAGHAGWDQALHLCPACHGCGYGRAAIDRRDRLRAGEPQARGRPARQLDTAASELGQRGGIFSGTALALELLLHPGQRRDPAGRALGQCRYRGRGRRHVGALGAFSKSAPVRIIGAETTGAADLFWYVNGGFSHQDAARYRRARPSRFSGKGSSTDGIVTAYMKQLRAQGHSEPRPGRTGPDP